MTKRIVLVWDLDDVLLRYNPQKKCSDWFCLNDFTLNLLIQELNVFCNFLGFELRCAVATFRQVAAHRRSFHYASKDLAKVLQVLQPYMHNFTINGMPNKYIACQNDQGIYGVPLMHSEHIPEMSHCFDCAPVQFWHAIDGAHHNKNTALELIAKFYEVSHSSMILVDDNFSNCIYAASAHVRAVQFSVSSASRNSQILVYGALLKILKEHIGSIAQQHTHFHPHPVHAAYGQFYHHLKI